MVPTDEARITPQILGAAVPPIGIASARLAMRPPVKSLPLRDSVTLGESPRAWLGGTLHGTFLFQRLNPPFASPCGCEPVLPVRQARSMSPFLFGSAFV